MTTAPEAPRPNDATVEPSVDVGADVPGDGSVAHSSCTSGGPSVPPAGDANAGGGASPPARRQVLLVDADPLLARLIEEWLAPEGLAVLTGPVAAAACCLVIVDLPYPRRSGVDSIREVASRHPGVPIIALSPTIFASVESCGTVSRSLGVDCVLAKPTSRDRLLGAVRRFVAA